MSSRRGYLTLEDIEQFADIDITDTDEAYDQISQAEEMIDAYVGPQNKFYPHDLIGKAQAGSTTSFILQVNHITSLVTDFYKGCEVQIIGGTGAGQIRAITGSDITGMLTTDVFDTAPDNTSVYRIYQLGKFPRYNDARFDNVYFNAWYKWIPENVRRATAAQLQYMIDMGEKFFSTDAAHKTGETIDNYSYTKKLASSGVEALIAPKAKQYLRGIVNRTGVIVYD